MKRYFIFFFLVFTTVFAKDADLTNDKKLYVEAKKLFKEEQYQKAYNQFYILFKRNLDDPNVNFYLGRSAYMLKKYELAISAYERVLMIDESSIRTKLEIAKCYFELKDYKKAQGIFLEAIKNNLPVNVKQNINLYLSAIESKTKRNFFSGSFVVGLNYDTNIYNRANDDIFTIPGIINNINNQPIQVKNDTKDSAGYAHQEALTLNHLYHIKKNYNFKNDFVLFNKKFFSDHEKDISLIQYTPALSITYNKGKMLIDYAVLYNKIWLHNHPLLVYYGLYPKLKYIYSANTILSCNFKYQKKVNSKKESSQRDAIVTVEEFSLNNIYSDAITLTFYAQLYQEKKVRGDLTNINNDMLNLSFSTAYKYTPTLSIEPKLSWYKKRYKGEDPFYLTKQVDNEYQFALNSTYLYNKDVLFNLSYFYTKHTSNIPSWEFKKHSITANVILLF